MRRAMRPTGLSTHLRCCSFFVVTPEARFIIWVFFLQSEGLVGIIFIGLLISSPDRGDLPRRFGSHDRRCRAWFFSSSFFVGCFRTREREILDPWYPPGFAQGCLGLRVLALLDVFRQQIPLGVLMPQAFGQQTFCPHFCMASARVAEQEGTRLVDVSAHHQFVPCCCCLSHTSGTVVPPEIIFVQSFATAVLALGPLSALSPTIVPPPLV